MNGRIPHARICGAKTRHGGPCQTTAVMANGRCRLHGGKSLGGIASPRLTHGRYSKFLPARLEDRYYEALEDTELLALREEIALVDARLTDLLRRVDTGEAGTLWKEAKTTFAQFKLANSKGEQELAVEALQRLDTLLTKGTADYAAWDEVGQVLEQRRRLVESERKRLVEAQQFIALERAAVMFRVIGDAIRRNVPDIRARAAIAEELRGLWVGQQGQPAELDEHETA